MGLKLLQRELSSNHMSAQEKLQIVRDIQGSVDISIDILNDLLNYEKLDAGIMKLEVSLLSAWSFVKDSVTPFSIQV